MLFDTTAIAGTAVIVVTIKLRPRLTLARGQTPVEA